MINYVIYTSLIEAQAREQQAYTDGATLGLIDNGSTGYAHIETHPNGLLFALPIAIGFEALFSEEELESAELLDASWANLFD